MESNYLISEACGICSNGTTICPLTYSCGHKFCMTCVYQNRHFPVMHKCPMCRTDDPTICTTNSPIFYLSSNTDYMQFYSNFLQTELAQVNSENIESILNKCVVLEYTMFHPNKNNMEKITYMGMCVAITGANITLRNCYHINRNMNQIYPTTPFERIITVTDMKIYSQV